MFWRTLLPPSSGWSEWNWEEGIHIYRPGVKGGGDSPATGSREGWLGNH